MQAMKRDKIVAVCFAICIVLVPAVTIVRGFMPTADSTDQTDQQAAILEGNGSMQDGGKGTSEETQTEEAPAMDNTEVKSDDEAAEQTPEKVNWFVGLQKILNRFTDRLFTRERLIAFNTALTSTLSHDAYIESTQVLLGKNDWLFYKTEIDGNPIEDYMGVNHFSEEELAAMAQNLVDNRDYFRDELGIRLVMMGVPNKESVYAEHMPDTVYRVREETRADQAAAYIQANTDLEYVYPKAELMAAKENHQVYYTTDTHWNQVGTFVGLQALFKEMYGTHAEIDSVDFRIDATDYAGDLATIAGLQDKYNVDTVYVLDKDSVDEAQKHDDTVLVVGDSFSGFLSTEAGAYYDEVIWKYTTDFTMDMIEEYQPDIIMWECTERYMENFMNISLKDK